MSGAEMIAFERERQISVEGWTPEHDDQHWDSELIRAAVCYAAAACSGGWLTVSPTGRGQVWVLWPWDDQAWKPSGDPVRDLVKAGALIAAEIDRLRRANSDTTDLAEGTPYQGHYPDLRKPTPPKRCAYCAEVIHDVGRSRVLSTSATPPATIHSPFWVHIITDSKFCEQTVATPEPLEGW